MAPQHLEKIESRRGNGSISGASDPQYLVHGRAADRARLRLMGRDNDKVVLGRATREAVGKTSRLEMAPQHLEKIESRRGNGSMSGASDPQYLVRGRAAARSRLRLTSRENDKVAKLGIFWRNQLGLHKKNERNVGNPAHRAPVASRQRRTRPQNKKYLCAIAPATSCRSRHACSRPRPAASAPSASTPACPRPPPPTRRSATSRSAPSPTPRTLGGSRSAGGWGSKRWGRRSRGYGEAHLWISTRQGLSSSGEPGCDFAFMHVSHVNMLSAYPGPVPNCSNPFFTSPPTRLIRKST